MNSSLSVVVRFSSPFGLGQISCWCFQGLQLLRALPFISLPCCLLNNCRRAAQRFFKIGGLFSLSFFFCLSLNHLRLLIHFPLLRSGDVHSNVGLTFSPQSVLKMLPDDQVSAMLHVVIMGPCKTLTTFRLQTQNFWLLPLLDLPPCCVLTCNTVICSTNFANIYTSTVQSSPHLLMLHSRTILVLKPLISICPFGIFSLCPFTIILCSGLSFYACCLLSFLTLLVFSMECWQSSSQEH